MRVREVQVFHIPLDATLEQRCVPHSRFTVEASTHDEARRAAQARLTEQGHTVRSLSFLLNGDLVAVLTDAPRPAPGGSEKNSASHVAAVGPAPSPPLSAPAQQRGGA